MVNTAGSHWRGHRFDPWLGNLRSHMLCGSAKKFLKGRKRKSAVISVQSLSRVCLFVTPWTVAHQASLFITNSWSLLKLTKSVMPSSHLILCRPLLLLPSIFPSIRVFSSESVLCIRWPKYWRFSFGPSSEYSGLISFRIDWFDLLAVQGTRRNLLQHQLGEASVLKKHQFFGAQLTL